MELPIELRAAIETEAACVPQSQLRLMADSLSRRYREDAHAPRNELLTAAEALRSSLGEGIDIGGVWLYPEDGIETDASDGVLAAMLRLEWIETAGEPEGEPMEELEYSNNTGGE